MHLYLKVRHLCTCMDSVTNPTVLPYWYVMVLLPLYNYESIRRLLSSRQSSNNFAQYCQDKCTGANIIQDNVSSSPFVKLDFLQLLLLIQPQAALVSEEGFRHDTHDNLTVQKKKMVCHLLSGMLFCWITQSRFLDNNTVLF